VATRPAKQEQQRASDEVVEVAPGVLRLQLPIQMPGLGHVNTYAMEDDKGIALVDVGVPGKDSWTALQRGLKAAGLPLKRVHSVFVTHSHPDHYGGAGRMMEASGATVVTHRDFHTWETRTHRCDDPTHAHDEEIGEEDDADGPTVVAGPPWSKPSPWGGQRFRPPLKRRLSYGFLSPLLRNRWSPPTPGRTLVDGEEFQLAGRTWIARHTPGHTVDHLCLHDPTEGLLLSGDHVLPTITPHISGIGTACDPLDDFLHSLDAVAALTDVRTVLPAHGQPFSDLAGRCESIKEHHQERLDTLTAASEGHGWATVEALSHELFRQRSWGPMAESETYAHLEHLRRAGRAERRRAGDVLEYRVFEAPA
jgi:glyoxylase-like metal-dependent hydrolase (beta-lactamase superfamily II)